MSEPQPEFEDVIDDEMSPEEAAQLEKGEAELEEPLTPGNGEQHQPRQKTVYVAPGSGPVIKEELKTTYEGRPGEVSPLTNRRWLTTPQGRPAQGVPQPGGPAARSWQGSIPGDEKKSLLYRDYTCGVAREWPTHDKQNRRLETTEELMRIPLIGPGDLEKQVRDVYGGGQYRVTIYDGTGIAQRMWRFKIPLDHCPAKHPDAAAPIDKMGNPVLADDELRELHKEKQRFMWQVEKAEAIEAAEHRRAVREKELRESKDDEKIAQLKRDMDERERRWAEDQRRRDEQFQSLMTQMNSTIQAIANRPQQDTGLKDMVAAMGDMTGKIMTALLSKKDDGGDTLKALMDSNRHVAEMAANNAKALADSQQNSMREVIGILTKQTDSSKQIKDYLEFSDRAEEKAFRFMEMLQGRVSGDDDLTNEDGSINWGGAIKSVVAAVKEMRSGAQAGAVPEAIHGANDSQLAEFAKRLIPYLQSAARAPAATALPAPMANPPSGVVEVEDVTGMGALAEPSADDSPAAQRREAVTDVVRQWVRDAEMAQIEPSWTEMALGTWGNLLDELAQHDSSTDGMTKRMGVIQANCDAAVFARFQQLQLDMNNPHHARIRKAWVNGFTALMDAFSKRRNG